MYAFAHKFCCAQYFVHTQLLCSNKIKNEQVGRLKAMESLMASFFSVYYTFLWHESELFGSELLHLF